MNFEPVPFQHDGQTKYVRPSNVLRLIALVEQELTPELLNAKMNPAASVALLHAKLLRFAGFNEVDEVQIAKNFRANPQAAFAVIEQCLGLLGLLAAPEELAGEHPAEKKQHGAPLEPESSRDFSN